MTTYGQPFEDYHGTKVQVDLIYKSAGVFVYLDVGEEFARLTSQQALDLAQQLTAAAKEAPK
jgi:hypothetical protein